VVLRQVCHASQEINNGMGTSPSFIAVISDLLDPDTCRKSFTLGCVLVLVIAQVRVATLPEEQPPTAVGRVCIALGVINK